MDSVTHVLSGVVAALAIPKQHRPVSRLFVPMAAVAGVLPDIDVFFIHSPINFLLLHRGISHSLVAIPFVAILLTLLAFPLWLNLRKTPVYADGGQMLRPTWPFWKVVFFFSGLLILHLWLDCVTTYGTMIFLPFSEYRVRLNGLFIIDLLLTIPLLLVCWHGVRLRRYAVLGLIWVIIYPAACVLLRTINEAEIYAHLQKPEVVQKVGNVKELSVLPDVFAPFFWRVIYQTDKPYVPSLADEFTWPQGKSRMGYSFKESPESVYHQGLSILGATRTPLLQYPALKPETAATLRSMSRRARAFEDFSLMPVEEYWMGKSQGQEVIGIYDLRFATMFVSIYEFLLDYNEGRPTFLFEARSSNGNWDKVRLIFGTTGLDSGWQDVQTPRQPLWWERLMGINY